MRLYKCKRGTSDTYDLLSLTNSPALRYLIIAMAALTIGCQKNPSISRLDQTAALIFAGTIAIDKDGICEIDPGNHAIENTAYLTKQANGSTMILFRTWQGKGTNLRGVLYTNGPPLAVGSTVDVNTFQPSGPGGGSPVGQATVTIDSAITKSSYHVSRSMD